MKLIAKWSFLFFLTGYTALSQSRLENEIDSLESLMPETNREQKMELLLELAARYKDTNIDKSDEVSRQGIALCRGESDNLWKGKFYTHLGLLKNYQRHYDSALYYFDLAEQLDEVKEDYDLLASLLNNRGITFFYKEDFGNARSQFKALLEKAIDLNHQEDMSRCYNNIGLTFQYEEDYESAMASMLKSAEIDEALNQELSAAKVYNNIALLLGDLKRTGEAFEYHKKSLELKLKHGDKRGVVSSYLNLGSLYREEQNHAMALSTFEKALEISEEIAYENGVVTAYNGLSVSYNRTMKYDMAVFNGLEAMKIAEGSGDNRLTGLIAMNLADTYRKKKDFDKARSYASLGLNLVMNYGRLKNKIEAELIMSELYASMGDYQNSLNHHQKYHLLSDSLLSIERHKSMVQLEKKYNLAKKEHQIELQQAKIAQIELENERNQIMVGALVAGIIILLLLSYLIIRRKKYQEEIRLEAQKAQWKSKQIKAVIDSQESERKRFAMDLHDGFGQLISTLRLNVNGVVDANKLVLDKSNQLLDEMYKSLKTIAFDLMPHTLMEKGLAAAVDELATSLNSLEQMKVSAVQYDVDDKLLDGRKVDIYRVIQELVSNSLKYSGATELNISLTGLEDELQIMIEDNGEGFDQEILKKGTGNGWRNISSRLEISHGTIEFDTQPGRKNTIIMINIPYHYDLKQVA